jgi:transcriptional regulator with XRE-family HTH domain
MYDFGVLRDLRKREGLNIAQVSERSAVSAAVISKLERNQTQPGLDTLYKLSRVFGMHPSDLLKLAESRSATKLEATEHVNEGILFQEITYGNVRCLLGDAPAGTRTSRPEIHGDHYEVCWVISGQLRFNLPHEVHELGAGQAIQFDAILEHTYEAMQDSRFILIHLTKNQNF